MTDDPQGIRRRRPGLLRAGGGAACALVITAVLASQLTDAAGDQQTAPEQTAPTETLSENELDKAVAAARREIESADATITSATVTAESGLGLETGMESNTGYRCTSDRVLQIKLIGKFPHTTTTGVPGPVEGVTPQPDGEVDAMLVTADAVTGRACLIGALDGGIVKPEPGATVLDID